jgi:hypothetical protein
MDIDLLLPRKWTLRADGQKVVFVKRSDERSAHVVMKALLWALYLPTYPNLAVEVPVGDRYKPDVVSLDARGRPCFWAEAGEVRRRKIHDVARRYRHAHLAIAKWDADLDLVVEYVQKALRRSRHEGPVDVIVFPDDSAYRFIDDDGLVHISHAEVEWERL